MATSREMRVNTVIHRAQDRARYSTHIKYYLIKQNATDFKSRRMPWWHQ
jgi:hypothetical protein